MKKALFFLILLYSASFALKNSWEGYIEERTANLNDKDNVKVILKKDPSTNYGNNFGYQKNTNFTYSTASGSSTITLESDSSISDMAYYHESGNTITINKNSNLIWNLNTNNGMILRGVINVNGGTLTLNNANMLDNQAGSIVVSNGGTINIEKINIFRNQSTGNTASIRNNGGNLNIKGSLYNHNKQSYGNPTNAGYILQDSGSTTITGSFYNSGFINPVPNGQRTEALFEIKGGTFKVDGNLENGKNDSSLYTDYGGIGILNASGGSEIIVGGNFISDSQGDKLSGTGTPYKSTVDLKDATLRVGGSFSAYRSDISLTGTSSIHTNSFFLDSSANMNFIGNDSGFGFINATNSATFNGTVTFKLAGALLKNDDMSYIILQSPSVSGNLKEGAVTVLGSNGSVLSQYTTNIVKIGDKYFLVFNDANDPSNPNYPDSSTQGPGTQPGGNPGGGNPGGNPGDGNTGGNPGGNPNPPTTPPNSDPIYNAIYDVLKDKLTDSEGALKQAAQTVKNQFDSMKVEQRTYQGSVMHHNMLGRIAHSHRSKYALNIKQRYASLTSDYLRVPYFENIESSDNIYVNALAGYSHYENSNASDYGVNFGYDKEIKDTFFGGFYASISKRSMQADDMNLDGYNYNVGLYSRTHLPFSVEFDILGYYSNSKNEYERTFAGLTPNTASYDTHNLGLQTRLGYRAQFINGHSLKPYIGLFATYHHMPEYKESGGSLPITRSLNNFTSLYGAFGLEYRKNTDNGGSFFIALEGVKGQPVFGKKSYEINMGGTKIIYENEGEFFGNVFAGANLPLSDSFDLSATVMSQAYDNGLMTINGSLGFRFVF